MYSDFGSIKKEASENGKKIIDASTVQASGLHNDLTHYQVCQFNHTVLHDFIGFTQL